MKDRDASTTTPIIDDLLASAERGQNRGNQQPPSICKVSRIFRHDNESFFIPQLVSIGPMHREDPTLQEFEGQKECYLNDLLSRCRYSTPRETFEACLLKVTFLIPKIRESYASMIENYRDADLARMMVVDGFFILEFCFKLKEKNVEFQSHRKTHRIAMDLILLENQVPFVVLQALFDCLADRNYLTHTLSVFLDTYLAPYIQFFTRGLPEEISTTHVDSDSTPAHVLGYLHKRYQLVAAESSYPVEKAAFHSIVELDRSGMNFKPHQEVERSMTIKFQSPRFSCLPLFWGKPTLLMPTLVIDDITESMLRNFIAYEQLFLTDRYYFTSYANAMDKLIDTQEDIAKLVESKVLLNTLGSNQEAADMINKLCKNIDVTEFYYNQEFKQVDKYYNRFWPKNIAKLRRIYFSNPRSAIALLAAMILFGLLVVSTIFTIKAA